jgi:type II secretion system protein G
MQSLGLKNNYMKPFVNLKRGFTLIELLVVIAIIGVFSSGVITILNPKTQLDRAYDAQRKNDLHIIQNALDTYYNDHGYYPVASDNKIADENRNPIAWGSSWVGYIDKLPQDPNTSKSYVYVRSDSDPQTYHLYAALDGPVTTVPEASPDCGSTTCTYGVASSNVAITMVAPPTSTPTLTPTPVIHVSGVKIYANAGIFTWTPPAGVATVKVECWGAGSGGDDWGEGGNGGAYSELNSYLVELGYDYEVVVGAGGPANAKHTAGGDSYFASTSTVLAKGGSSPLSGYGGQASA